MVLHLLDRFAEAAETAEESAGHWRALLAGDPAAGPALALCLVRLGLWREAVGRDDDAREALQEALLLHRALAEEDPGEFGEALQDVVDLLAEFDTED